MPKLRQLPMLFLRGSLANETMKDYLCRHPRRKRLVDRVTEQVIDHDRLRANRSEYVKQLGRTIGGDYKDDPEAAHQEYRVAIWRGVVQLLYHCSYDFECMYCHATTYMTQRGRPAPIDRRSFPCPACRYVQVADRGWSGLPEGGFVSFDELQDWILRTPCDHTQLACTPPRGQSPIRSARGERKVQSPKKILRDPDQLHKFFSEFLWNYFRQIINENQIAYHRPIPQPEFGPADRMAVYELLAMLQRHGCRLQTPYDPRSQPEEHQYHVYIQTAALPPALSMDYVEIAKRYRELGVNIILDDNEIIVPEVPSCPLVEVEVMQFSPVLMSNTQPGSKNDDGEQYTINHLVWHGGGDVSERYENNEVIQLVREQLPEGHCQIIFDLLRNHGEQWKEFSNQFGDNAPKLADIASFLGTTPKNVSDYRRTIKTVCLAHGFHPGNVRASYDD